MWRKRAITRAGSLGYFGPGSLQITNISGHPIVRQEVGRHATLTKLCASIHHPRTLQITVLRPTWSVSRRKNNETQFVKLSKYSYIHYYQISISDCYLGVILHEFNI